MKDPVFSKEKSKPHDLNTVLSLHVRLFSYQGSKHEINGRVDLIEVNWVLISLWP